MREVQTDYGAPEGHGDANGAPQGTGSGRGADEDWRRTLYAELTAEKFFAYP